MNSDVKNWESPSPFAFIQFADIQSVVRAINAYALSTSHSSGSKGKLKVFFLGDGVLVNGCR